jgi:hypothetical protein
MAKNRKSGPATLRFGLAVKALLFCSFIAASGVGYVWQKGQLQALGHEITQREALLGRLRRENRAMQDHLDELCLPSVLDLRVRTLNLGLTPPAITQVLRLYEAPTSAPAPAPDQTRLAWQASP